MGVESFGILRKKVLDLLFHLFGKEIFLELHLTYPVVI